MYIELLTIYMNYTQICLLVKEKNCITGPDIFAIT